MPTSKETPTIHPPSSPPPPPPTPSTNTTALPQPNNHPLHPNPKPHPVLLALSGPTSSGKTTLATALHALLPPPSSLLIHADDFYKPDSEIPLHNGVQDWDCAGSLDLEAFEGVLRGLKTGGGEVPEGLLRQGNFEGCGGDGDGEGGSIGREVLERLGVDEVGTTVQEALRGRTLVIVDGFLLFGRSIPASLKDLFDIKILLRARYEDAKRRRERRNGYVTVEGFWRDPEGYFDGVVWPNYVGEYGGLVEGEGEGEGRGVRVSDERWGLEECLEWVVGVVRGEVEALDARVGDMPGGW